jgi:hypothetical protein
LHAARRHHRAYRSGTPGGSACPTLHASRRAAGLAK